MVFDLLFSEFHISNVKLKNRLVFLPHVTGFVTRANLPSPLQIPYFAARAKGGVGLIIGEGSQLVHPSSGNPWFVNAWDPRIVPIYRRLTNAVHKYGAKIFCQLHHSGSEISGAYIQKPLLAPSPIASSSVNEIPKELDREEILAILGGYKTAARHAMLGGYDGIEVKASHDGLIRQFWSPATNKRLDEYGGSLKNRLRFSFQVFDSIRTVVGRDFPLGARMSLDEMLPGGYTLEQGVEIGRMLSESKLLNYISTDLATLSKLDFSNAPMCLKQGYALESIHSLKSAISLPVIAFGRIILPQMGEEILQSGIADLVGMCRQLLADPETPIKALQGRVESIRYCIGCNQYCMYYLQESVGHIGCILNPEIGHEKQRSLTRAHRKKKILVIGGGLAGLKVAEMASKRNHDVILFEKAKRLGGAVTVFSKAPFRQEFMESVRFLVHELDERGVDIRLDMEMNSETILNKHADAIVIATGSKFDRARFSNISNSNILSAYEVLKGTTSLDGKVVVYDESGHQEGLSVADYVSESSKDVELITPMIEIGRKMDLTNLRPLLTRLKSKDVKLSSNEILQAYHKHVLTTRSLLTEVLVRRDNVSKVVVAGANVPNDELYLALKGKTKSELFRIGDCVAPRMADMAILEGARLGQSL